MSEVATQTQEQAPISPANTEVAPEAPKAEEAPKAVSKEYQLLLNREKALQRAREQLKAEKDAIEAEKQRVKELEDKYGKKPKSPREALERYGWSYKDATDWELNEGNPTPEAIARQAVSAVEELRREQEAQARRAAEDAAKAAQAQQEAIINDFKQAISDYIDQEADSCEMIKLFDAKNLVYDTVEAYFSEHGKVLSIKEAAALVEKYFEDRSEQYLSSKRYQAKQPKKEPAQQVGTPKQEPRTLSNAIASSSTPTMLQPHVEADRIKRALAALG